MIMHKVLYKVLGLALVIAILGGLFFRYHLWVYLSLNGFNQYHDIILEFEQQHLWEFSCLYILSYILLIALCMPGTILFDLLAGFLYGPYLGTVIVVISYLLGAIVNFILVRYLLKELFQRRFFHLRHLIMRDNSWVAWNLMALRLIPVIPFWVLNILAAVLEVPITVFALTTLVGIIPVSIIYVLIGNGVSLQLQQHKTISADMIANPRILVPLVLLALLILVPNAVKAWRQRRIKPNLME